jgi:hypothetical protein
MTKITKKQLALDAIKKYSNDSIEKAKFCNVKVIFKD